MVHLKVVCAVVVSSFLYETAADECISFGANGLAEVNDCGSVSDLSNMPKTLDLTGQAGWAVELDSGIAILIDDTVQFWTGGSDFTAITLGGMTSPVAATPLDGKLYVACFGSWPDPQEDSGLAIIDVASQTLETTHSFSDGAMHVHNVYAFEFGGKKEIFAAILGNPWTGPLAGRGLSRFDRASGSFDLDTTDGRLSVRSAKQQADGSIFVLTQEPGGEQTKLARLVEANGQLAIEAQTLLPPRQDGDGGADVVLGFEENTIWVTDRLASSGILYHYTYSNGQFTMDTQRSTGANPRYAVALDNGDIVVCNQNGNDLSVYKGLANSPTDYISEVRVPTVNNPMFFMKTSHASSCTGGDDGADLESCVHGCPSHGFSDCLECCSGKFPSHTLV